MNRIFKALTGLVAVGTGLAVGEFVSALQPKWTSPVIGVGNRAIDLAPRPVKEFAIETFGTNDKLALLLGIGGVLVVLAAIVGVLSYKRLRFAVAVIVAFGFVGSLAAFTGRTGSFASVVPSVVASVVALGALLAIRHVGIGVRNPDRIAKKTDGSGEDAVVRVDSVVHRSIDPGGSGDKPLSAVVASPASSSVAAAADMLDPTRLDPVVQVASGTTSRRTFLAAAGFAVIGAGFAGAARKLQSGAGNLAKRAGISLPKPFKALATPAPNVELTQLAAKTPFFTPNKDFYRIDTALVVPKVDVDSWRLKVTGLVENELSFSYEDILSRPLVERDITLTCVSNEVGGILMGNARWLGVPLRELLDEAGVKSGATQIAGRSIDGWSSGFPTEIVTEDSEALVAIAMNGEPLPFAHGFPARLIVPGIYGYASATKWLTEIELTTENFESYWVPRGYAKEAPIKLASRIDVPQGLSTVPAGRVAIAGVAWAQPLGISAVEVSIDGGEWQKTELSEELSGNTWRQWHLPWDAVAGQHEITVRAYDNDGNLQIEDRTAPLPNGATGWHQIVVFVS